MLLVSKIVYRQDFETFARDALQVLNDRDVASQDPYLEVLFDKLGQVANGTIRRLIVNMPPRHLKSLSGVALAAWVLGRDPRSRIIIVSYGEDLAKIIAGLVRRLIKAEWYRSIFGNILGRTDTSTFVETKKGGAIYAASFAGSITGKGADLIIVDDPHKISDAGDSDRIGRTVRTFMESVITRLNDFKIGRVIVLAHRIEENDLSGRLLLQGKWQRLCLPMVAPDDIVFELSSGETWNRQRGAILRANAFDCEDVEALKAELGPRAFEALYQQNPGSGSLGIDAAKFRWFSDAPPAQLGSVLSIDWAYATTSSASCSVAQVWRRHGDDFYLVNQLRARCDFHEFSRGVRRLAVKHHCSAALVEQGSLVEPLENELRRTGVIKLVEKIDTKNRSKLQRFDAIRHLFEERRVCIPRNADWLDGFMEEVTAFPHGETDDQVDALSQALSWFKTNSNIPKPASPFGAARASLGGSYRAPYILARMR